MKLPCDIVQDLLPLYEDNLCSQATREAIEEHLRECEKCGRQHTAVQELVEPEVVVEPKQEKKAAAKSFKKIRNRWIASIVVILLLIPMGYLAWGQYQGVGASFTNLRELYMGNRFVHYLETGEYEKAFQYWNLEDKKADWLERSFTEEEMENFEADAQAKFLELAEKVEQAGGIDSVQYLGVCVGGNTFSGETYYRLSFSLEFEGMKTKMEMEVTNGGVLSYSTSTEVPELNLLSMWSEYLWQDYRGCYFDPELGEYVYYDKTN